MRRSTSPWDTISHIFAPHGSIADNFHALGGGFANANFAHHASFFGYTARLADSVTLV